VLDLSSPAAVRWYQDKLAALFDLGIAAIKVDYGDGAPAAGYAALPAAAARAAYPLLYQDAVWQASRAAHGDDAVIWARAGWAGAQRYPVHWSGDGVARFADLACVLRAMLSMSLSGFHFYSHDVGGFSGQPDPELYLRWLQLGIVSSHVRAHGSPPREPWAYGPEAEGIARDLLRLRYRLLPYLYTAAVDGVRTARPLVRPLLLERPADPVGWGVEDQFWLGPDLMAAPVLERSATSRSVYLPAGDWYAYGTGEHLAGGRRHEVATPLAEVPLFVRGGAVVPLGPDQLHVGEHPDGPLELHFWGEVTPGRTVVRLDAGTAVEVAWEPAAGGPALRVRGAPGEVRAVRH
jgi:alpha-D-xyloside xylohydrolase